MLPDVLRERARCLAAVCPSSDGQSDAERLPALVCSVCRGLQLYMRVVNQDAQRENIFAPVCTGAYFEEKQLSENSENRKKTLAEPVASLLLQTRANCDAKNVVISIRNPI